jgi:hypothetical protein
MVVVSGKACDRVSPHSRRSIGADEEREKRGEELFRIRFLILDD